MTRWEWAGRIAVFAMASFAALGMSSIVELYWPELYEHIVEGAAVYGLLWLIFWRGRGS